MLFSNHPIEQLETRRMLSAVLIGKTLKIDGTDHADHITVVQGKSISVVINGKKSAFAAGKVSSILVNGKDGSDVIDLSGTSIGSTINAGDGRDRIFGSQGPDRISGNDDNDFIDGKGGNDSIDGDNGDDTIKGGNGDDSINGGDGGDSVFGGAGDDFFDVKDTTHEDTVYGSSGHDEAKIDDNGLVKDGTHQVEDVHS